MGLPAHHIQHHRVVHRVHRQPGVRCAALKVVGGVPVLFVETEYTKESKDPKATAQQVGAFKIAVRAADTQTFVCSHNDLGYVETFKKLVTELATGLKAPKVDAQYVQIDALRMGDTLVGFKETRVRTDAKTGGRYIDTFDSRLLGKGVAELSGEDETSQAIVDKAGNLAAEKYMLLADGDVALDVTLRRKAGKEYTVDGKQKGAPVKGTFKAQKEITTPYSRAAAVKKLVVGKDEQAQFSSYAPRVELSAALEETYKKQDGVLVVDSGALGTAKVKVDAEGLPEKAEATGQGTSLLVERIEARGTP